MYTPQITKRSDGFNIFELSRTLRLAESLAASSSPCSALLWVVSRRSAPRQSVELEHGLAATASLDPPAPSPPAHRDTRSAAERNTEKKHVYWPAATTPQEWLQNLWKTFQGILWRVTIFKAWMESNTVIQWEVLLVFNLTLLFIWFYLWLGPQILDPGHDEPFCTLYILLAAQSQLLPVTLLWPAISLQRPFLPEHISNSSYLCIGKNWLIYMT